MAGAAAMHVSAEGNPEGKGLASTQVSWRHTPTSDAGRVPDGAWPKPQARCARGQIEVPCLHGQGVALQRTAPLQHHLNLSQGDVSDS